MTQLQIRKTVLNTETVHHEGGPVAASPLTIGVAAAVVRNPYSGRYQDDILPLMEDLKPLGEELCKRLLAFLGNDPSKIEVFGKASIVGVNGELEHAALWHAPGGHSLREILGARGFVPSSKMMAAAGARLMVPLLNVNSVWVRSHFNVAELTIHDAPRPDELVFAVAMGTGGRIHARVGGMTAEQAARIATP
jgi:hypothetical protein